jgi:hypothetical protein
MQLKLRFAVFVISMVAVILLVGCPPNPVSLTSFSYSGPQLPFGAGGTAPLCPTCQITGVFTLNSPLGFGGSGVQYTTYELKANGRIKSFDFKISGWTLGGTPPEYSSTNGAIVVTASITGLDSKNNLGNWNIEITDSGRKTYIATCIASAAFMVQYSGQNPWDAGFPPGTSCQNPSPAHDIYSGGGNTLLQGNGPGVMTGM